MKDCIFCKFAKEGHPHMIYEDNDIISFLDIKPANRGHCLVMTKKHYKEFLDVNPKEFENLMKVCQKITKVIMKVVNAKGYNVIINGRKIGGQVIDHMHIHLVPRFENDGFILEGVGASNEENKKLAEKIKSFL